MTGEHVLFEEDKIMKNNSSIKTVVAVGIGAALFFVLGRFVAIPTCHLTRRRMAATAIGAVATVGYMQPWSA